MGIAAPRKEERVVFAVYTLSIPSGDPLLNLLAHQKA